MLDFIEQYKKEHWLTEITPEHNWKICMAWASKKVFADFFNKTSDDRL